MTRLEEPARLDRPEVAREVNRHILELAESDRFLPIGFLCECGCLEQVVLSAMEYTESNGAFRDGHSRIPAKLRLAV